MGQTAHYEFRNLFAVEGDGRRNPTPSYMGTAPPPRALTDGAVCDETVSWMFEARSRDETMTVGVFEVNRRIIAAKAICNGSPDRAPCPVRELCLKWALGNDYVGVFGGQYITWESVKKARREHRKELA